MTSWTYITTGKTSANKNKKEGFFQGKKPFFAVKSIRAIKVMKVLGELFQKLVQSRARSPCRAPQSATFSSCFFEIILTNMSQYDIIMISPIRRVYKCKKLF